MKTPDLDWFELSYQDPDGQPVHDRAAVLADVGQSAGIRRQLLRLGGGPDVWRLMASDLSGGQAAQAKAYEQLDSEILAGLRLHRLVRRASITYPPQLSQMHGYDSDSADPFVLLIPWRGQPVSDVASRMLPDEQNEFLFSLLKGLSWLAAANIAHRCISPASVRWDHARREAQITDFSLATVVGVPRAGVGSRPWAGPEQQPNHCPGLVTDRDDLWGAGQLLYYVHTGEPMAKPTDLDEVPALKPVISRFFAQAQDRPAPREVLMRLSVPDPVPAEVRHNALDPGRQRFRAVRGNDSDPPEGTTHGEVSRTSSRAGGPARPRGRRSRLPGVLRPRDRRRDADDLGIARTDTAATVKAEPAAEIVCPVCLGRLRWEEQPLLWRFDAASLNYVELPVLGNADPEQRRKHERGALVRCPDPAGRAAEHFLPADYVRYGKPVVLGFVGATSAGKTHLLSAMVGEIEGGALGSFGLSCHPLDPVSHLRFMDAMVKPLLRDQHVISPTKPGLTHFADGFLIRAAGAPDRLVPVALFDVAGAELGSDVSPDDTKAFLDIADGLIFVIDPVQDIENARTGEDTFNTVLYGLSQSGRLPHTNAAIVLNKADLVRFDDPITKWFRTELTEVDPDQIAEESADIYAYMDVRGGSQLTRPYRECGKGTLHAVSPTGGPDLKSGDLDTYPRGVRPRRVLAPLLALLAMTGVIPGPLAARIGV